MKCERCGTEIAQGDQFCGNCGAPRPPAQRFCGECGAAMKPGQTFCNACGSRQEAAVPAAARKAALAPVRPQPVRAGNKSGGPGRLFLGLIALVALLVAGFWYWPIAKIPGLSPAATTPGAIAGSTSAPGAATAGTLTPSTATGSTASPTAGAASKTGPAPSPAAATATALAASKATTGSDRGGPPAKVAGQWLGDLTIVEGNVPSDFTMKNPDGTSQTVKKEECEKAIKEQMGKPIPIVMEFVRETDTTGKVNITSADPKETTKGTPLPYQISGNSVTAQGTENGVTLRLAGQTSTAGGKETLSGTVTILVGEDDPAKTVTVKSTFSVVRK